MKLQPDASIVRAITPPYQYYSHFVNGKQIRCKTPFMPAGKHRCQGCPQDKPRPRWFIGVIDKSNNKYSILSVNAALFKKIQDIVRNPEYGDPKTYDMEITINDTKLMSDPASNMYTVLPLEKTVISIDEEEFFKLKESLVKLTDPICATLEDITNTDDFKEFYLSVYHDSVIVEFLSSAVPKWYPKFKDVLHNLITFS